MHEIAENRLKLLLEDTLFKEYPLYIKILDDLKGKPCFQIFDKTGIQIGGGNLTYLLMYLQALSL